jgi:hypothetical protein
VPLVSKPRAFACRAERLAWAGAGPNRLSVWNAGTSQGMRPDADSCEEVALRVLSKIAWVYILDAPFVYVAGRDVACLN